MRAALAFACLALLRLAGSSEGRAGAVFVSARPLAPLDARLEGVLHKVRRVPDPRGWVCIGNSLGVWICTGRMVRPSPLVRGQFPATGGLCGCCTIAYVFSLYQFSVLLPLPHGPCMHDL